MLLDRQAARDLMWIGPRFRESDEDFGAVVVHGHWVCDEPHVRRNRIGIDTGAYASGVLTCLVLHGEERELIQVLGPGGAFRMGQACGAQRTEPVR